MFKRSAFIGIGALMIFAPALASADTVSSVQAQIQSLLSELQGLQQRLIQMQQNDLSSGGYAASASASSTCPVFRRVLSRGEHGNDVSGLQNFLIGRGFLAQGNATGFFGSLTQNALQRWQSREGIVSSGDPQSTGWGVAGPRTRSAIAGACAQNGGSSAPVNTSGEATSTISSTTIVDVSVPGSVTLPQGGIGQVRDRSFYFTVQSIGADSATIAVTPVGCWNSFPSDTPPQIRCMIAVQLPQPQTLTVGATVAANASTNITLASLTASAATFSISDASSSAATNSASVAPTITGIDGPTSLATNESGAWTVHVTAPGSSGVSYSVIWGDEAQDANASIVSYANAVMASTSATFTHAYASAGTYAPVFTVSNANGSASSSATVIVSDAVSQASTSTWSVPGISWPAAPNCTAAQNSCNAGYKPCTGASCQHIGWIANTEFYCLTSISPVTVVPVYDGESYPVNGCYNEGPVNSYSVVATSTDLLGCPLPTECVPD